MMTGNNNDHVVRLGQRAGASHPEFIATTLSSRPVARQRVTALGRKTSLVRVSHDERGRTRSPDQSSFTVHDVAGYFSKLAVILIVPVLIFRPLLPLYAADESVAPAPVETASIAEVSVPAEAAEVSDPVVVTEAVSSEIVPEPVTESTEAGNGSEADTTVDIVATETPTGVSPLTEIPAEAVSAEAEIPSATTSEAASEDVPTSEGEVLGDPATASSTPDVVEVPANAEAPQAVTEEEATTPPENTEEVAPTEEVQPEEVAAPELTKEEIIARELESRSITMRQELKKEIEADVLKGCLTLDGVGYYCLKDDARTIASGTPSQAVTAVRADVVAGGTDKEIVAELGTETIRITDNDVEDAFPAKDAGGTHVVWQTQEAGRWQIYFADMSSGTPEILQLTHGTESNFNPRVDGESVVWQGWAEGNWEIFLADKLSATSYYASDKMPKLNTMLGIDSTWHVVRVTQNSVHDMFPAISGGLVTWQSFEGGVWSVYAYSVTTGKTTKLSDDGAKSENPRFAVTWDERGANGETRMMGYDIATGGKVDMTQAARNVIDDNKPYVPQAPHPAPEPLALPGTATTTGTSTAMRASDGGDDNNGTSTDTTI